MPPKDRTLRKPLEDECGGGNVGQQHKLFHKRVGIEQLLGLNVHGVVRLAVQAEANLNFKNKGCGV